MTILLTFLVVIPILFTADAPITSAFAPSPSFSRSVSTDKAGPLNPVRIAAVSREEQEWRLDFLKTGDPAPHGSTNFYCLFRASITPLLLRHKNLPNGFHLPIRI